MKKRVFCLALALVLLARLATASVIDAPHNATNNMTCSTCHSYSMWWQYSPSALNLTTLHATVVNGVCVKCHDSEATLGVKTHSGTMIDSGNNYHQDTGGWGMGCTDCHNPHYQEQLDWDTGAFLVEGKIDRTAPNNGITNGTVTIDDQVYDQTIIAIEENLTYKDQDNWPLANWTQKTGYDGRSLILSQDRTINANTFTVLSATATRITVKGKLDPEAVIPDFDSDGPDGPQSPNTHYADTFGLAYGQLIKKSVIVPYSDPDGDGPLPGETRTVKFVNPVGGFVDTVNTPATGICQVCHTLTADHADPENPVPRFRNTGDAPGEYDSHADYINGTTFGGTSTCTTCHAHQAGFKGNGHGEEDFGWAVISYTKADGSVVSVNCAACHDSSKPVIEGIHRNRCGLCHVNERGGGALRVAGSGGADAVNASNGIDGDPSGATRAATCATCHDKTARPNIENILPLIHHAATAYNYAANDDCTHCHKSAAMAATPLTAAAEHSLAIGLAVTTGAPGSVVNGCDTCHQLDAVTGTDYSTHGTGTGAIIDLDPAVFDNPRVHDRCVSCHKNDGGLKDNAQTGNMMVPGYNPGHGAGFLPDLDQATNCLSCHGTDSGLTHLNHSHALTVGNTPQCNWCHVDQIGLNDGAKTDPNNDMVHDDCTTCHTISKGIVDDYAVGLIDPLDLTRYPPLVDRMETPLHKGSAVVCTDCHGIHLFMDHQHADHTKVVKASSEGCTETCHIDTDGNEAPNFGMNLNPVDNRIHDECTSCHDITQGKLRTVAEVNKPYVVAMPDGGTTPNVPNDGGGECAACHGDYGDSHNEAHNHRLAVAVCADCHGTTDDEVNTLHKQDCQTCHGYAGTKLDPATVAAAIAGGQGANGVDVDCETCHGAGGVHDTTTSHNHRQTEASCVVCHPVDDQAAIDTLHQQDCGTCHGYRGTKLDPATVATAIATGKGATGTDVTCRTCHTANGHHDGAAAANNDCATTCHTAVDHSTTVAASPECVSSCHASTAGTTAGVPLSLSDAAIHDACRTCHTFDADRRGILVNFTNQKGVTGDAATPLPAGGGVCSNCHTVAVTPPGATLLAKSTAISAFHHANPHAKGGQCETCHVDPRPSWGSNIPGDNGDSGGGESNLQYQYGRTASNAIQLRPTQMACRKCHVAFTASTMTVTKFTRSDYSSYKSDWNRTPVHTLPVTAQRINNYGICLSCHHQGGAATPIKLWHANPSTSGNYAWTFYNQERDSLTGKTYKRSSNVHNYSFIDKAHFAPGRSKTLPGDSSPQSGIAGFNIFAPNYGVGLTRSTDGPGACYGGCSGGTSDNGSFKAPAYDTPLFSRITIPTVSKIGLPTSTTLNATTRAVPVFASIAPIFAAPQPATDSIKVQNAIYDNVTNPIAPTLTVVASTSNSGGCGTMTATYGGAAVAMSGAAASTCTATITTPDYPAQGMTVDVTTSNTLGLNVMGYPIATRNPGVISFSANSYSVAENGGVATITVRRSVGSTGPVSVYYATAAGGSATDADYTAVTPPVQLDWGADDMADKTFTIAINNDSVEEGDETVNLVLSAPTGADLGLPSTAQLTIVDNDKPPAGTIAFSAPAYTVAENGGSVTITATRTGGSDGEVSVDYGANIFGSTAVAGADYPATSGTLVWASGNSDPKTFTITTVNHGQLRGNRTVNLYLHNATGASLGAQNTAVLTIESPALRVLNEWPATPNFTATTGNMSGSFIIGSGPNRLMLVAVSSLATGGQTGQTFTVTYGGKPLTQAALQNNRNRQSWIGYLKEEQIATRSSNALAVTISGTHSHAAVFVASYVNVSQCIPIGAVGGNDWNDGVGYGRLEPYYARASTTSLGVEAGGYGIYHWTGVPGTVINRSGDDAGYTEHADGDFFTTVAANVGVASRPFSSAASTWPNLTWAINDDGSGNHSYRSAAIQALTLNRHIKNTAIVFSAPTYSVNENGGSITITATRLGSKVGTVSVDYEVTGGTAVAGTDYTIPAGPRKLTWADGVGGDITFVITINDNPAYGANKTVNLAFSPLTLEGSDVYLGSPSTAVLTIVNDEAAIGFSSPTYSVDENDGRRPSPPPCRTPMATRRPGSAT